MNPRCLIWLTQDLRLSDHMALYTAVKKGYTPIPVFIYSEKEDHPWEMGAASKWWLHHSLISLSARFKEKGSRLILRRGPVLDTIESLILETGAEAVYWHRRVEPFARKLEERLEKKLSSLGISFEGFYDHFLFRPGEVLNGKNEPYQVFTPFYKACLQTKEIRPPIAEPSTLPKINSHLFSVPLEELALLPEIPWDKEFHSLWQPGELRARERLKQFVAGPVEEYPVMRDFPSTDATSLMSPHLHFGEISPQQIWKIVSKQAAVKGTGYLRQLIWREFAHHMLYFFPSTDLHPLRKEFAEFPWKKNAKLFSLWKRGQTGYPIVDAGMRQLRRLGWMHNRLRMIVGSFLVKDLFLPWQEGEKYFWDTLLDADLSNNAFGWQWVGGCGADAAPYFRIFNPILQSEKFDPDGHYIRAFVPELKDLPKKWIHKPWLAPEEVLRAAGITLGAGYPRPIVCHDEARKEALLYFQNLPKEKS